MKLIELQFFKRWQELREAGVKPKDRFADPELAEYDRQLRAVQREMKR